MEKRKSKKAKKKLDKMMVEMTRSQDRKDNEKCRIFLKEFNDTLKDVETCPYDKYIEFDYYMYFGDLFELYRALQDEDYSFAVDRLKGLCWKFGVQSLRIKTAICYTLGRFV